MSGPINNLALSLSDIPLKTFVRGTREVSPETVKKRKFNLNLVGEEAKLSYDEIVSLESQRKSLEEQSASTSKEYKNKSKKSIRITSTKSNNTNAIFKAIESADKEFISQHINSENVNIIDQFGWTPLMSAACSGHIEIVNFLLKLGANTKVKDKRGFAAIDLAIKKNHLPIVNLLKQESEKRNNGKMTRLRKTSDHSVHEETESKDGFYCEVCKINFIESSRTKHETSVLHIFNSNPKITNAFYGIPKQNRGYQMLLHKGWNEEGGLGPSGEGQKYPVKTILKRDRKGFGQPGKSTPRITHFEARDANSVKFAHRNRRKPFKKRDRERQLSREALKTKALRQALS